MHRFNNPHPAGGHMRSVQQQQPQMQQQQNAGGIIPLPNGMVMLPNGMVVTPQQAQALTGGSMMPSNPGMQMNPNMPMNMNMMQMNPNMTVMGGMPMNTGRFGNQNQAVTGGITGTAFPDGDYTMDSRFQSTNTNMVQPMEEAIETPPESKEFSITVTKGVKFAGNSKVVLTSYYDEVKANQIYEEKDKLTLVDCFEEAVESCIDHAHDEDVNKLISVGRYLVENSFYKAAEQPKFNELILDNDIKNMYKAVKAAWPTLTNKYDIHMFDTFDTIMTDTINDFISINSPVEVHIDSFMSDFNELLKFLRNLEDTEEDLEDELINYMNSYISQIKSSLEELNAIDQQEGKKVTYIPEKHVISYIDKYSHELGVLEAPDKLTKIEDNLVNVFIMSAAKTILSKQKTFTFYMVTIDKIVLQFAMALNGDIFIKKV